MHISLRPYRRAADVDGFTLLEVSISLAIFSVVMLMLFTLSLSLGNAAQFQEAKITTHDDARSAMMILESDIRQAASGSINWAALPATTISYRIAQDLDGNGFAVDENGDLELGLVITVGRDTADLNSDGLTNSQLVRTVGTTTTVLANGLMDDGAGPLDRGVLFQRVGNALQITIQTQRPADAAGTLVVSRFSETIVPRN